MKETIYRNLSDFVDKTVHRTGYWFPLDELTEDIPVAAYDIEKLFDEQRELLEDVLRQRGIEIVMAVYLEMGPEHVSERQNIFELLREERSYKVFDLRFWRPRRWASYHIFPSMGEAYYFDESKTWLIYVSHEGTLTFAGAELAAAARRIIPDGYLV